MMGLDNPLHIAFRLIVFGTKRMPEMGRSLGEGLIAAPAPTSARPAEAAATGAEVQRDA